MSLDLTTQFAEQVSVNQLVQNVVYASRAIIAYKKSRLDYFTMGAMAGYVSGAAGLDVYRPWQMFLVAMGAPFVAYAVYEFLRKKKIDEHKLIPLFIGAGTYGLLMVGVLHGGTRRCEYWHGCCDGTCPGIHSQTHNRSESV